MDVKSLLKKFFSNWKNILILLLICAVAVLYFINKSSAKKIQDLEAEKVELVDTLFDYKNKANEYYLAKETYITDLANLKKINQDLAAEVKKLKDNPIVVTKIEYETKIDSIKVKDTLYVGQNNYTAMFDYSDDWAKINGYTFFDVLQNDAYTTIDQVSFKGNFYFDLIEKNKKLYSIARTDNPYVQINNIETAIVSPDNSKVLKNYFRRPWGIMVGVGPSVVLVDNTVKICPAIQVTIGYKFIDF